MARKVRTNASSSKPGPVKAKARRGRRSPKGAARKPAAAALGAGASIVAWIDDPASNNGFRARSVPNLAATPLAMRILTTGAPPPAQPYQTGTPAFRYWTAAEALRRASDFWGAIVPASTRWFMGQVLPVQLDVGEEFNAYYNRQGLQFYHGTVAGVTIYTGESPDIVCHELGHAVLDAIRPQLFDAPLDETAAFHEAFGDVSSLLCALQLDDFRAAVLNETGGRIAHSSSLSRVGEQFGWALRQISSGAAEADCLRNIANAFFYRNPSTLPPAGPATTLTSEAHSFSRVFTGAFLEALAGMLLIEGGQTPTSAHLLAVSRSAGRLIVAAAIAGAIVPSYFAQIANKMIAADAALFNGRYTPALRQAFVRRGILSLKAAFASMKGVGMPRGMAAAGRSVRALRTPRSEQGQLQLDSRELGIAEAINVLVQAPDLERNPYALAAALDAGDAQERDGLAAANAHVQDLVRRGRVDLSVLNDQDLAGYRYARRTHTLRQGGGSFMIRRERFDCGFDVCSH